MDQIPDPVLRYQRRAEDLQEDRIRRLQAKVDEVDAKVDALAVRFAYGTGAIALLIVLMQLLGPLILERLIGG
jgi:hypothetical protein